MNVFGKRTFAVAFDEDAEVHTLTATSYIRTPVVSAPSGGPLTLDGNGGPVSIPGNTILANATAATIGVSSEISTPEIRSALALHVNTAYSGPVGVGGTFFTGTTNTIASHPSIIAVDPIETPQVSNSSGVLSTFGQTGWVGQANTGNANLNSSTGDVNLNSVSGHVVGTGRSMLFNGSPVVIQTYVNTLQANYTPAGAGLVSAVPDTGVAILGWPAGWEQRAQWGWVYDFSGDLQAIVGSSNQLEVHVLGGPASATTLFTQFTNAIANTGVGPFDCGYRMRLRFSIVATGSPGTGRISMDYVASKGGGDGLPVCATVLTSDFAYDSTIQQIFTVQLKTSDPTANLSVLFAQGIQYG